MEPVVKKSVRILKICSSTYKSDKIVMRRAFPSSGDLMDPGIEPASPALAGGFYTPEPPRKPQLPLAITELLPATCMSKVHKPKLYLQ